MKKHQLFVPGKTTPRAHPQYGKDMRTIETLVNNLPTSGVYKSLTGPGETTTPGDLTQLGSFTITGHNFTVTAATKITLKSKKTFTLTSTTDTIILKVTTGKFIYFRFPTANTTFFAKVTGGTQLSFHSGNGHIQTNKNLLLAAHTAVTITSGTSGITLTTTHTLTLQGGSIGITTSGTTTPIRVTTGGALHLTCSRIGFYSTTPIAKPTLTGSRTGNVALLSVINALSNLGLAKNTTTP